MGHGQGWRQLGGVAGRRGVVHAKAQNPQATEEPAGEQRQVGARVPSTPNTSEVGFYGPSLITVPPSHAFPLLCFPSSIRTLCPTGQPVSCDVLHHCAWRSQSTFPASGTSNSMPPGLGMLLPGQAGCRKIIQPSLRLGYDRKRDRLISLH